jgi:DNA-binding NarL/FixJ family response regulator
MIRVILADDHHLVRKGIRSLLEKADDIKIVAEAENGSEAVDLVKRLHPNVLVMDIAMPRLNGIQAAERIAQMGSGTAVVLLSMHSDETLVRQANRVGVKGYLLKRSITEELLRAIRVARLGERYLSPEIPDPEEIDLMYGQVACKAVDRFDRLSPREREVLQLITEGYTNKEIAGILQLSIKTIEKHRSNLMNKLHVNDLPSLLRVAFKNRLVFLDN